MNLLWCGLFSSDLDTENIFSSMIGPYSDFVLDFVTKKLTSWPPWSPSLAFPLSLSLSVFFFNEFFCLKTIIWFGSVLTGKLKSELAEICNVHAHNDLIT